MIKSGIIYFITLALLTTGLAQENFENKISLGNLSTGWQKGYLPYEVVNNSSINLSDLRILQIKGKDTIEAPYVLIPVVQQPARTRVGYKAINKTSNERGYYATFQIDNAQPITELELISTLNNYDWKVTLQGSMDQKEWFNIVKNKKLIRIRDGRVNFTHNTLHFSPAQYTYFRVQIKSERDPLIHKCLLYYQKENSPPQFLHPTQFKEERNQSDKQSYTIDLQENKTINSVQFSFADTLPFYRTYTLYEFIDSVKIKSGWHKNYRIIDSGTLSSVKENRFQFRTIKAGQLKLEIDNYDNPPLTLTEVKTLYPKQSIVTRIATKGDYTLFYNDPLLRAPQYDLAHFINHEITYTPLEFGQQESIALKNTDQTKPIIQSDWWLWGVLVLIIATMAFAVFKMMMKAD